MKKLFVFFVIGLAVFNMSQGHAQEVDTQGRDFWVSFLPNFHGTVPKLEILVAGQNPCSGKATNPLTGWSTTFTVTPGVVTSVVVPNGEGLMEMSKINSVEHRAIHVTTTEDVSVYASNYYDYSFDVANVLPTNILQDNYMVQSYDAGNRSMNDENARMLVVATENNTEIAIDPKGGLRGVLTPFSTKNITLNSGECYMCVSASGDISGTTVRSKNGKKIAVFSGGDTQIPANGRAYDAVFEQSMPVAYWGRHFVVTATAMRDNDMIRITALSSGCRISIDGRHKTTLGARKSYDFKLDSKKKEAVYISASSPVCVCVYLTSYTMGGPNGDPSMVTINPIEQTMDKVTFASFKTLRSEYHYVNVVTQTNQVNGMTLDGVSIANQFKVVPHKKELSYARVSVQHGSHTLESRDGGFVAHVYGLGEYESYAYTVGSSTKVLNQFNDEGDLIISNIPDDPVEEEEPQVDTTEVIEEPTPVYTHTDTLPPVVFEGITLENLKRKGEVKGLVTDDNGVIVDPSKFDITADPGYDYLFEDVGVEFDNDTVVLVFQMRASWCDCFVPERIPVDVVMTPKESDDSEPSNRVVVPIIVPIVKETPWISRCMWVLEALAALLVLFCYLRALSRKRRFKKHATVTPVYYNRYNEEIDDGSGQRLRNTGIVAWFARWFLPGTEKRTLSFESPEVGTMKFMASDSVEAVEVPKNCIDVETMEVDGYYPESDKNPSRPIRLGANCRINVNKRTGEKDGYLYFTPGSASDGKGYRLFVGLLMVVDLLSVLVLLVMLIRGLL